jgi:lipid-binding SYLF domain-containing protein
MTTIRRGSVLAALGLLATAAGARADSLGELAERLRKATAVLSEIVSLTAGPKSLHDAANTDGSFKAEIFSYARSSGFFAGASFEGATVQPDASAIRTLYGVSADSREVLLGGRYAVPAGARPFVNVLTTYSPPPKKR